VQSLASIGKDWLQYQVIIISKSIHYQRRHGKVNSTSDSSTHQRRRLVSNHSHNNQFNPTDSSSSSQRNIPFYGLPQRSGRKSILSSLLLPPYEAMQCISAQVSSAQHQNTITQFIQQSLIAIRDPTRADAVAAVGEMTGRYQLVQLLHRMQRDPIGQQILRERPIVSKTTIPYDRFMEQARSVKKQYSTIDNIPSEQLTFGVAYGLFLLDHVFDPDERDDVKYLSSSEDIAYVMLRYRQCHDYWHVLTNLPPTVNGEIGLKLLELFHLNMPVAALSCIAQSAVILSNTIGTTAKELDAIKPTNGNHTIVTNDIHTIWNIYLPWARQQARNMQRANVLLLNVDYEHQFALPLHELREKLHIQPYISPHSRFDSQH
jgi:ubiquinone biosynthesis protein COQ4